MLIVHNHFRPGGVRRVIELETPHFLGAIRRPVDEIILVGGEGPDPAWLDLLRGRLGAAPVACAIDSALGYVSEQRVRPATLVRRIRRHLEHCLAGATARNCVVWAHNPGLGRNLPLARELDRACAPRGVRLIFHHHDWWFDQRWRRWPEMRRTGIRGLADAGRAILPDRPNVRHAAINQVDARILRRHFGSRAGWLPNPAQRVPIPPPARMKATRRWLRDELGDDAPVWLVPCRLLRRKNLAEALLLTRWLRPEAWLVSTGGVSSADESAYAAALREAGRRRGWRLRLGILEGDESKKPAVSELVAASEVLLLTSLQEGFGLPNIEAASAGRPFIVRSLPNVAPDLAQFGFDFPQSYRELLVDSRLFDREAEDRRQVLRWRAWRDRLPARCRRLAGQPVPRLGHGGPVSFSRLTLIAQLEVLANDPRSSWEVCAPLNPHLDSWRARASGGNLAVSRWPRGADRWLGAAACTRRFARLLRGLPMSAGESGEAGVAAAGEFIRAKLAPGNQYPLLWNRHP